MQKFEERTGTDLIRKASKRRWSRRRKLSALFLACAALLVIWLGYCLLMINSVGNEPPERRADVGIVLGMSMWGDNPSPGLKERLDRALEMYKEGKVPKLIVSGGLDRPDYKYTEAEGMQRYLVAQGVPESDILLENEATSTVENLRFSQDIMRRESWSSAIIITHTYHGRRALEIAETLDYAEPELALTESKVMSMAKHKSREVLAYTKWKAEQLMIRLGF